MDPLTWYLVGLAIAGTVWGIVSAAAISAWIAAPTNEKAYTARFAITSLAAGFAVIVWPLTLVCLIVYGMIRLVQDARSDNN